MQSTPQNLLKEYVQSQHFTSTTEIMSAMKEMFRDVIQTVMEVEMDEELVASVVSALMRPRTLRRITVTVIQKRPSKRNWEK